MKKSLILAMSAAALIVVPGALSAQNFGVGVRGGTTGIGVDAGVGLGSKLTLRGGFGVLPFETDASSVWDPGAGVDITLKLPDKWYNVGVDLDLISGLHVGGGMMFKPNNIALTGTAAASASFTVGDKTYTGTDVAELTGTIDSKTSAPYASVGFGKLTSAGIGLYMDLGVVFLGDSPVKLEATKGNSTIIKSPEFQAELRKEEAQAEADMPAWARSYWPILSLGLKFGVGN